MLTEGVLVWVKSDYNSPAEQQLLYQQILLLLLDICKQHYMLLVYFEFNLVSFISYL